MKKTLFTLLANAVLLLTLSGCLFNSEPPQTTFYDLQLPAQAQKQSKFRIVLINNNTPSRTRMVYRQKNNQILQDEYNCWVQLPERMLMRYIAMAYPWGKNSKELIEVRATITAFEFNANSSEAIMALNYRMKKDVSKHTGSIIVREKVKSATPEEFAAAMSKAAARVSKELADAANNIK